MNERYTEEEITAYDRATVKYFLVATIALLIGTIQGVVQIIPPIHAWVVDTGNAGMWIDPLAHTHINLVGGVTMALFGIFYYILPRVLKRPIYSHKLGEVAFWFSFVGVWGFYSGLMLLGYAEGTMMENQGVSYNHAAAHYWWINFLVVFSAFLMGFGYWGWIYNIVRTIFAGEGKLVTHKDKSSVQDAIEG